MPPSPKQDDKERSPTLTTRRGTLATVATLGTAGCLDVFGGTDAESEDPHIDTQDEPALDRTPAVTIEGVDADAVRLEAEAEDAGGQFWRSVATYPVEDGTVALADTAPVEGSYDGVDPWGPFWSMEPAETDDPMGFDSDFPVQEVTLQAFDDGTDEQLAEQSLSRRLRAPESEERQIETEVYGTLVEAPGDEPAPGVVLLHGSAGVPLRSRARVLAAHGYTVLALRYFGSDIDALPDALVEVPVEYVEGAIDWLTDRESVSDDPVAVGGISRGGELAMLLGARRDDVGAVINWVGAGLLFGAFVWDGSTPPTSAWSIDGDPLAHPPHSKQVDGGPAEQRYRTWIERTDDEVIEEALIPLEEIDAPILLVSAGQDAIWPSKMLLDRTERRLDAMEYDHRWEHRSYENAGHGIGTPSVPTWPNQDGVLGGTPAGTARASIDIWPTVLEYIGLASESS